MNVARVSLVRTLLFVVSVFVCTTPFFAQAQNSAGVGIKPSIMEELADPGEVFDKEIKVANLSDRENTYFLIIKDIKGVTGGNAPIFADPGDEHTGYELSEWLELESESITLAPGEEKVVRLKIRVPENATPGSHFGGIFVSLEPPRLRRTGAGVGFDVANIVIVQISGDITENTSIREFTSDKTIYSTIDVAFQARIENKGNVLSKPTGPLEIYNMFGTKVATLVFNGSKGGIFPGSIRTFDLRWESDELGFGRYEAMLSLSYGTEGSRSSISRSHTFWILPMNIITPALIILGVVLLSAYISVRVYVNRRLRALSGGRRIVQKRRSGGTPFLLLLAIVLLIVTALFLLILLLLFA